MIRNPYKYLGPLDPVKDKMVLVSREDDLKRVIDGIKTGEYWGIFGTRQIGKTTFLRQIRNKLKNDYHIYTNFEIPPVNERDFYQWLMEVFTDQIPSSREQDFHKKWDGYEPGARFMKFLREFKPRDDKKRIILRFDEIERIPSVENFLHIWRDVYNQRNQVEQLKRYSVIITGSRDMVTLSDEKNSPYNIANFFYMKDFSQVESERLIRGPLEKLNIEIEEKAITKLVNQTGGHPQILQQICHCLVEQFSKQNKKITETHVTRAIEILFESSYNLDTLKNSVMKDMELQELIRNIFQNPIIEFNPYKKFSLVGIGTIVDRNGYCQIRNPIYKRFIKIILEPHKKPKPEKEKKPLVFTCYSHQDQKHRNLLYKHLKILENTYHINIWDDQELHGGQEFSHEIEEKLKIADIAIFLVSADSLISSYINKYELPILRERSDKKEMTLFPVRVRPCSLTVIDWLKKLHIHPKNGKVMANLTVPQREKVFTEIIDEIIMILKKKCLLKKICKEIKTDA